MKATAEVEAWRREIEEDFSNLVALLDATDPIAEPARMRTLKRCLVRLHTERCSREIELPGRVAIDPNDGGHSGRADRGALRTFAARLTGALKAPRRPTEPDFRTKAQRNEDAKLVGTWWRCPTHGLTEEPLLMAGHPFCPEDVCDRVLLVVASGVTIVQQGRERTAKGQPRIEWGAGRARATSGARTPPKPRSAN